MTKVINIRDKKGTPDEVYIGRGSKWGNPFVIGKGGTRDEVIEKYREYIMRTELPEQINELNGKTLICYCKPYPCHGDVLIELLGEINVL
jgi:hypothetical protein